MRIRSTEQFVEQCRVKHHDFYDYSESIYQNTNTKICIICPKHGHFWQKPIIHRRGKGCPTCGKEKWLSKTHNGTKEFVARAKTIHGERYDYSKTDYISMKKPVTIICHKHGEFKQSPEKHLMGQKCFSCSRKEGGLKNRLSTKDFIAKAKKIHGNRYDYSKTIYTLCHEKLTIICKKHGPFLQIATNHIHSKNGCPACMNNCISASCTKWLDSLGITTREYRIPKTNFKVDGFDPVTNTVYEYYGLFWHGHPDHYSSNDINPCNNQTYGQLYQETIKRERILHDLGYNIISKWE